ncbi:MAG: MCE family protein [Alphaproteobacteria bacterium]|nr:MCE family protein [Alphaproteobacteria bacterium]MBV9376325.1 MCE family protein [Alphaproteobacteria bacterium]
MSNLTEQRAAPLARTRRSHRVSIIWIVPAVAVAIGAWLAWDTLSKEGPTIKISFDSGEGLQAGQSQLKYKDIVFGTVKSLELAPDRTHVIATIATTHEAKPLLTEGTLFWVVKPRFFAGNISGIETLLSGSYIGMLPAANPGKSQQEFVGREDPPVLGTYVAGRTFLLKSKRIGSVSVGSPIFFRDLNVGEVLGWDIADMAEYVTIHAFVRAPYDSYVHDQTRFWNASGVSIKLGGTGIDVQMESLKALLLGGVAFDSPTEAIHAAEAPLDHVFPLFADRETANAASYTRKIPAISYFPGSVSGLAPGAAVTVHGLKVGEVTDVRLTYDAAKDEVLAPVRYEIEPERVVGVGKRVFNTDQESVQALLKQGLRASLQSASLITGQQNVSLDFVTDAPPAEVTMDGPDYVVPATEGGGFASLTASATELLNKVNTMPFEQIGKDLDGILKSTNDMVRGPQVKKALTDLAGMIASAQGMIQRLDTKQLPELVAGLDKTLTSANKLVLSLDNGYGDNTKFNRDMERLLVQANDALRSIRALSDLLARHPEALIKGRPAGPLE